MYAGGPHALHANGRRGVVCLKACVLVNFVVFISEKKRFVLVNF